MLAKIAFSLLSVASSVLAHGILQEIDVSGPQGTFVPWMPYQDPYKNPEPQRVGRKILSNGPVEDVTSIDIQCNKGAVPAPLVAPVDDGGSIGLNWTTWPASHKGPLITYLAKAPSDITKWNPGTDKVWFKIHEAGLDNGKWATETLLAQNGVWTVKIPQNLQPGEYLMRHEIIALHSAQTYPGAQLYPSCIQFKVTGSGTAFPSDSELVAFPGAYKGTDPGITYNLYTGATTYTIPGPPVWDGSGSGSGNGGSGSGNGGSGSGNGDSGASPSSPSGSPTPSSGAPAPSGTSAPSAAPAPYKAPTPSGAPSGASAPSEAPAPSGVPTPYKAPTPSGASTPSGAPSEASATPAAPGCHQAPGSPQAPAPYQAPVSPSVTAPNPAATAPPTPAGGAGALYAQCGGNGFNGPKSCVSPYICKDWNPYYSQCVTA